MSTQTFSVLTSDIKRNPSLLSEMQYEAAVQTGFQGSVTVAEHGPVTTVTAMMA